MIPGSASRRSRKILAVFLALLVFLILSSWSWPLTAQAQTYYYTGNLPMVPAVNDAASAIPCNANAIGAIRYNTGTAAFEGCNGVAWADIRNGAIVAAAGSPGQIQFNSGGLLGANPNFVWDNTNGLLGIGTNSPTYPLSFTGQSAQEIWMERETTAATSGYGLTVAAGGAVSGGTDLAGGDLTLSGGTATGAGNSKILFYGSFPQAATNTTDNAPAEVGRITGGGYVQFKGTEDSGDTMLSATGKVTPGNDSVMVWYPRKGAFEAVTEDSDGHDDHADANIGKHSAAFGIDNRSSGDSSMSWGYYNIAQGDNATAFGNSSSAYGDNATSFGSSTTAYGTSSLAFGRNVMAGDTADTNGNYSMAIGLNNTWSYAAVYAKVTGNGSMMIAMQDQTSVNMTANNAMALLGGSMIINPATGSGAGMVSTPDTALDVRGSIKVGDGAETCGATYAGAIRYNTGAVQFCNGTSWANIASAGGATWNGIANPTGNQALTMGAYTSTLTYNAATGSGVDMFKIADTAANSGTGYLMNITTGATSAASPLHLKANTSGDLVFTSAGRLGIGSATAPATTLDVNGGVTIEPAIVTLTANNTVLATANRSYFQVTSDNTTAANRIFCFGAGTLGQVLVIEWTSSTNRGQIVKGGNCGGAAGAVTASISYTTWAPKAAETILQLMYNGTHWIQIAGSANY